MFKGFYRGDGLFGGLARPIWADSSQVYLWVLVDSLRRWLCSVVREALILQVVGFNSSGGVVRSGLLVFLNGNIVLCVW